MAPLRRYIRLTPHTTLQTLIFLEDPSVLNTWLIHPTRPALPHIINSLRDLILPKLREERDRERKSSSSKKNKAVKDVVVGSDFEVSVFFKDGATRHAVLRRKREFLRPKTEGGLKSNSSKMTSGNGATSVVGEQEQDENGLRDGDLGNLRIENEDDESFDLAALPLADPGIFTEDQGGISVRERTSQLDVNNAHLDPGRRTRRGVPAGTSSQRDTAEMSDDFEEQTSPVRRSLRGQPRNSKGEVARTKKQKEPIFVNSDSDSEMGNGSARALKDEKKPLFSTRYEGYSIYGKILYLIVKKLNVPTASGSMQDFVSPQFSRDVPFAPDMDVGVAEDGILEGWMYMSQAIREDPD